MEILIIVFLLLLLGLFLYLIFRGIKWILDSKNRKIWAISILGIFTLVVIVNHVFFKRMEFIQSKVYPDLYLIKNPISSQDSLHKIIKTKVLNTLDNGFVTKNENAGFSNKTMRFYEYTTAWGFNNGTKHFIENKEDPGGFSSEVLDNYYEFKTAYFEIINCKNDSINYFGNIIFYKEGNKIKTDTLVNLCN